MGVSWHALARKNNLREFSRFILLSHPAKLSSSKEERREGPVDQHLAGVDGQRDLGGPVKSPAVPVHKVAGISHAAIQVSPNYGECNFGRVPPRLLQFLEKKQTI